MHGTMGAEVMTMSRRRPAVAVRLIAVPAAAALLGAAAPAPGTQPWLVVGLVFFGVAAVGLLAAVGVKMRRTPGPPSAHRPGEEARRPEAGSAADAEAEADADDGDQGSGPRD
ncbi:hypothetical protein LLS1_28630 [Leifsonia sp. LS1]|uniref:hypothetical protein n=1 Tax=Leifsonia sp. LS1 TaxID=2828483 RepID=UPI001CFE891B|nr:hypothetical protein [Leifsonia sp. LS1]GIT81194.1 hypothetical protein LLS1_28630 [Leifsonia sp. LS1]